MSAFQVQSKAILIFFEDNRLVYFLRADKKASPLRKEIRKL
jgi:hypothetical protein